MAGKPFDTPEARMLRTLSPQTVERMERDLLAARRLIGRFPEMSGAKLDDATRAAARATAALGARNAGYLRDHLSAPRWKGAFDRFRQMLRVIEDEPVLQDFLLRLRALEKKNPALFRRLVNMPIQFARVSHELLPKPRGRQKGKHKDKELVAELVQEVASTGRPATTCARVILQRHGVRSGQLKDRADYLVELLRKSGKK